MKLIYKNIEHVLNFENGCVSELVVENKRLFFEMVNDIVMQSEGASGKFVLSFKDRLLEISKNIDVTVQFAPFQLNRKSLLSKLSTELEKRAMQPENSIATAELLMRVESYMYEIADDFPFGIDCKKNTVGAIIRALSPEIEEVNESELEKIFSYMEIVRELDKERLYVMVNMRTYFNDEEMEQFAKSSISHDFKVLLLESVLHPTLKSVNRYIIDQDLCEF